MIKRFVLLFLIPFCCLKTISIQAQQLSLKGLSFLGVATNTTRGYFYDGGGFELNYQHDIWKGRVVAGIEYRMINWGNQVGLNMGYNLPFYKKNQWRLSATLSAQVGMALFSPKPLAAWGVELLPSVEWQSKKRFFLQLDFGFRMNHCPAYKDYGSINMVFDMPIKIGIGFRLGKFKKTMPVNKKIAS